MSQKPRTSRAKAPSSKKQTADDELFEIDMQRDSDTARSISDEKVDGSPSGQTNNGQPDNDQAEYEADSDGYAADNSSDAISSNEDDDAVGTDEDIEALDASDAPDNQSSGNNDHNNADNNSYKNADKTVEPWVSEEAITGFFDRISGVTSSAFKFARKTTDTSYKVGKALMHSQDQLKLMVAAGQSLKDVREVAGLTISELNEALQLKDQSLLEAVENGTATLSFELILRLSALLARNDPIPFILKFSRTYSPETWRLLNDWGAGRLPIQYQREREFINIFRSKDEARQLSDEGYARVLEFTREAFNMSLHFVAEQEASIEAAAQELEKTKADIIKQMQNSGSPSRKKRRPKRKDKDD